MSGVQHWDDAAFAAESVKEGLVLLDFYADWCGPCRMLGPILEQLAAEFGDKVRIGKINIETSPDLAAKFGVQNIPALFILKNGEKVREFVGIQSKAKLLDALKEA